jgi:hypothetical protein
VFERWNGIASIFDRHWQSDDADVIVYADAACDATPLPGSFGKGSFSLKSLRTRSDRWTESELKEAKREKKHSSTHLELLNMLESVLFFSETKQKVLCYGDNSAAIKLQMLATLPPLTCRWRVG